MCHNHWHRGPCCLTLWVTRGQRRDATAIHRAGTSPPVGFTRMVCGARPAGGVMVAASPDCRVEAA
jgi:hypothetical protein